MKVIGVAGQLAQGKDVLSDELCRILNQRMVDAHLADRQESARKQQEAERNRVCDKCGPLCLC